MDIKQLISSFKNEDFFENVNLHIHSTYSDGHEDFDKLIEQAKRKGMKYISITDHNTCNGYKNSKYKDDSILIKGIEFDCIYGFTLLHILGYGIDINNKELNKICAKNNIEQKNDIIRLLNSRSPQKVINAIHNAGGIAVLAHPCCCNVFNLVSFIKKLKKIGLDGIETRYPYNELRGVVKFSSRKTPYKVAQELNLIQTGGSDEHYSLEK